jgi:RNA polymerase sigma factor (sigma-70 family)
MANSPMSVVLQHFLASYGPDGAGSTDGELLTRFVSSRDEAALNALVRRHASMVWGVCRRLLHCHHDAEDAFQATFLVFLRKARVVPRHAVANWLYGVARQTAVRLRATAAKRRLREAQRADMPEPAAAEPDRHWNDLQPLLDQELSRLPDRYRAVVVLCDLEGKTRKEAARQLDLPEGTVGSRLARARVLLAKRLTQRGVALSGGALAAMVARNAASAKVPASVVSSTIQAASLLVAGQAAATGVISAEVAALTEGVLKAMLFNNLKTAGAVLLVMVLVGLGGGGAKAFRTGDESDRVGYQPPGVAPVVVAGEIATQPGEVALDAAGGRGKPYFYSPPDPTNVNHLWKLTPVGEYYLIESKLGELALDACGGRGSPYLRHSDPTNINHLWKLVKVDACYLIVPKVGDGELALNANGGKGNVSLSKADATDTNCLWELRKHGDSYLIVPLVRRVAVAPIPNMPPVVVHPESGKMELFEWVWHADTGKGTWKLRPQMDPAQKAKELYNREIGKAKKAFVEWTTRDEARREIERLLKRADEAGVDREAVLEEIEKTVKNLKEKAKKENELPR